MLNRTLNIILLICLLMPMNLKSQDKTADTTAGIMGKQKKLNFSLSFLYSFKSKRNLDMNSAVGFNFTMNYRIFYPLAMGVDLSFLTASKTEYHPLRSVNNHKIIPVEMTFILRPFKNASLNPWIGIGTGYTYQHKTTFSYDEPDEIYRFLSSYSYVAGLEYKGFLIKAQYRYISYDWKFYPRELYMISFGRTF
jgi:opacity protein-like surface antigen